uniref:Photosystem II 10 kDa polypeptide, chloroplastic n=1 Tax=Eutreptiella gymnastica TaxID=73025 RepID=A0A7S1IZS9_9EUGL
MSYNQYTPVQESGPSKLVIGGVACATTLLVAAATFAMTAPAQQTSLYTAQAVRPVTQVGAAAPMMARPAVQQPQFAEAAEAAEVPQFDFSAAALNPTAAPKSNFALVGAFTSMLMAVAASMFAAFGYRSESIAMAMSGGAKKGPLSRSASKGGQARGGQAGVGYKGSTIAGSAPTTRDGKPGFVYKLGVKNGLGNVDEYSPIYEPSEWKADGDVYEPGALGLAIWAAGFLSLLGVSGFLIYYTSAL